MQRINVEMAAPEMVVAQPIQTPSGQVLCSKGTQLTETLIARLEKLEISHIIVEGHPVDDGKPRKTLEEELAALDRRFRGVTENKLMGALKMIVKKHLQEKHAREAEEESRDKALREEAGAEAESTPSA